MKKYVMWKAFIDYEKEENWLNEMSAKGLMFTDYFLFRYTFTDCEPGEYIYRIELLNSLPATAESQKYLAFMAENGVEHVSSWARWVYFKKRAADGPFDIYSDIDSRITHYRRICTLFLVVLIFELLVGVMNLSLGLTYIANGLAPYGSGNFIGGVIVILIGVALFIVWNRTRQKMSRLKREKQLRE